MTAIVTGASGFIGSHLVDRLIAGGEEVRCLVRRPVAADSNIGARYIRADFSRADLGIDNAVFDGVDVVYHVAGATRAVSPGAFTDANVGVTQRLIDRMINLNSSARFLYVSSQAASGPTPAGHDAMNEDDEPAPVEPYGRSKLEAERVVLNRATRLPVTVVRPVAVYGPRDKDFLAIFRMLKRGLAIYPGIRDATVSTIYIDDLIDGIIGAAQSSAALGQTYFLGHLGFATWRSIYGTCADVIGARRRSGIDIPLGLVRVAGLAGDVIGRVTGRPPLLSSNKALLAAPRYWTCSSARAARDFGFSPTMSLRDGIETTCRWYRDQRWL